MKKNPKIFVCNFVVSLCEFFFYFLFFFCTKSIKLFILMNNMFSDKILKWCIFLNHASWRSQQVNKRAKVSIFWHFKSEITRCFNCWYEKKSFDWYKFLKGLVFINKYYCTLFLSEIRIKLKKSCRLCFTLNFPF